MANKLTRQPLQVLIQETYRLAADALVSDEELSNKNRGEFEFHVEFWDPFDFWLPLRASMDKYADA